MILPTIEKEKEFQKEGFEIIIGVDEVGRGPLAGPVVAGAAWVNPKILEEDFELRDLVRDSKLLSEIQREKIHKFINDDENFVLGIGEVSVEMIDKINILNASLLAMRLAVDEVLEQVECQMSSHFAEVTKDKKVESNLPTADVLNKNKVCVLIDGNRNIQNLNLEQKLFAKGDQRIFSIAVASIQAKVYRDKLMIKYHREFPEYGFDKHKGYGTKFHMGQLKEIGACVIHRRSFRPVREVLE